MSDDEDFLIRVTEDDEAKPATTTRYAARAQRFTPHFREQVDLKQSRFTYVATTGTPISVELQYRLHGTGSSLWDSSIVLLKYLERTYNTGDGYWRGKRVLELGAGVGLCGIVLAHYGAHVTMTDIGECLQLLRRNIDSNRDAISGGSADCVELLWSSTVDPPASLLDGEFDFILATDCLLPYNPELLFALSHTMARLMKSKKTVALVTFEERFNVAPFFESCRIARLVESAVPFDEFDAAFRDEAIRMVQLQQR